MPLSFTNTKRFFGNVETLPEQLLRSFMVRCNWTEWVLLICLSLLKGSWKLHIWLGCQLLSVHGQRNRYRPITSNQEWVFPIFEVGGTGTDYKVILLLLYSDRAGSVGIVKAKKLWLIPYRDDLPGHEASNIKIKKKHNILTAGY